VQHAVSRKMKSKGESKEHWLDYADDKFDASLISDIKAVMRVLTLYVPLPIFWTLFDQQVKLLLFSFYTRSSPLVIFLSNYKEQLEGSQ
jgi:hypothetical protein